MVLVMVGVGKTLVVVAGVLVRVGITLVVMVV